MEKDFLENIAKQSLYSYGASSEMILYSFKVFKKYIKEGSCILEMGPAEGVMTDLLVHLSDDLTICEGSKSFCHSIKEKYPKIDVHNSLFEEFSPKKKFDCIIMGHVLEHVENPVQILKQASDWLVNDGLIIAAVPNARSLHRQAAVLMGLLKSEWELNEMDKHHGHRRVYNPETFRYDFLAADLKIDFFGGYWMKPVSNKQIEENWSLEMLNAFMQLGERYPDISAELYIVASKK